MTLLPGSIERLRAWASLLPLLALLGATYWLNQQVQPLPPAHGSRAGHGPDFSVTRFTATTLNTLGTPHYTLFAQEMVHYPNDDSALLEDIQLVSHEASRPALIISAGEGKITGKGDEVFLSGEVHILRTANGKQSERAFTTNSLQVIPDLDLAKTSSPITMTDKYNTVYAVGMELDNKARTIKLLSQVRSEHVAAPK